MKLKHHFILPLMLCLPLFLSGQIKIEVKELAAEIAKHEILESAYIGIGGEASTLYQTFSKLSSIANNNELLQLLENESVVLQGYILQELITRKYQGITDVFKKALNSKKTLSMQSGCTIDDCSLASLMFSKLTNDDLPKYTGWSTKEVASKLKEFAEIAFTSNATENDLLTQILSYLEPSEKHAPRIIMLCKRDSSEEALKWLASLKREEDVPFIKSFGNKSYLAIRVFPHPKFLEFLSTKQEDYENARYIRAIAQHKNVGAVNLLNSIMDRIDKIKVDKYDDFISNIYTSLLRANDTIFDELLLRLWSNYKILDKETFVRFKVKYANSFVDSLKKGIKLKRQFEFVYSNNVAQLDSNLMRDMFYIVKNDSEKEYQELIQFNIKILDDYELLRLLKMLSLSEREKFKDDILLKLQSIDRAYDIHEIMIYLIKIGDANQLEKIGKLLKEKKRYWDWGNWSETFRDDIKRYKIPVEL